MNKVDPSSSPFVLVPEFYCKHRNRCVYEEIKKRLDLDLRGFCLFLWRPATIPQAHTHTQTYPLIHCGDSTIETAPVVDFLPLWNPGYFRVATPNSVAEVEKLSAKYGTLPGSKRKEESELVSH